MNVDMTAKTREFPVARNLPKTFAQSNLYHNKIIMAVIITEFVLSSGDVLLV